MSRLSPIVTNQVKKITPVSINDIERMNADTSMMAERARKEIASVISNFKDSIKGGNK